MGRNLQGCMQWEGMRKGEQCKILIFIKLMIGAGWCGAGRKNGKGAGSSEPDCLDKEQNEVDQYSRAKVIH